MTRKKRMKLQRERKAIEKIDGSGLKVEVGKDFRCDKCGNPAGTLYRNGDSFLCYSDVPESWIANPVKMLSRAVSGRDGIRRARTSKKAGAGAF